MAKFNREKVLQTARALFVEEGYQAVSMRKIAQTLGYSHGTLYYHFKDKAALISEILKHDFAEMRNQMLQQTADHHPLETLRSVLYSFIRFGVTHPHPYRLMFIERDAELQQHQVAEGDQAFQILLEYVWRAKSELRNLPPAQIAWMMFMAAHGFISRNLKDSVSWEDLSTLAESFVDMILRGLTK
ncbi:TetR/AcrR family transcriptional regulator [Lihuaxuella thermophila]|uniref:DNA-binding transcriptional regulator, AcrR family n=1 Tax=Lihuaxuella thermophila TaxID=1173111 RepID=A0A1H8CSA6_9BACL|nr:TetR/AcrR family transcriptional regulator [Lihuaxuella thermophila]SEM97759.1 DNA-binding transcriptional regulator, AcrR family [Lihuaxuella thermophila]